MILDTGGHINRSDMEGAMVLKKNFLRLTLIVALSLFLIAACAPKVAVIGSPYERYDHNRQQKIGVELADKTCTISRKALADEVYAPFGSSHFPSVHTDEDIGGDKLPTANVVPIFTGISLPLSNIAFNGAESDRRDLIEYLSVGQSAKAGVERTAMVGDIKTTEKTYQPILTLLESQERLSQRRDAIIESLSQWKIDFAEEIIDSRYSLGSFQDALAIEYKGYWFILYKLSGNDYYSRLVVVPLKMKGQDVSGKRP